MPAIDASSQLPSKGPYHDADDGWAMPLGQVAGLRLYLSYSVFVATAVLVGVITMVHTRPGNSDLPMVALFGVAFWALGWAAQTVVQLYFRFTCQVPIDSMTIGLFGVEFPNRRWDARHALVVSLSTLAMLLMLGVSIACAGYLVNGNGSFHHVFTLWRAPGFGLGSADEIWFAGAWMCWIQMLCQSYPLPKSSGRTVMISFVTLVANRMDEPFQTHFSRRGLQIVALITSLLALVCLLGDQAISTPRWPLLMLLALTLWISSRGRDVRDAVLGLGTFPDGAFPHDAAATEPSGAVQSYRHSWISNAKQTVRSISHRRRLRQTLLQEHQEAEDTSRLDDVLNKLHTTGRASLSSDELAILQRVSDNLRRQRELESAESDAQR